MKIFSKYVVKHHKADDEWCQDVINEWRLDYYIHLRVHINRIYLPIKKKAELFLDIIF